LCEHERTNKGRLGDTNPEKMGSKGPESRGIWVGGNRSRRSGLAIGNAPNGNVWKVIIEDYELKDEASLCADSQIKTALAPSSCSGTPRRIQAKSVAGAAVRRAGRCT